MIMNKHLSKASGIWAKNVYIENEQKHYIFTEKSLERFAQDILDECMYLCVNELADPRDTPESKIAIKIREHFRSDNES